MDLMGFEARGWACRRVYACPAPIHFECSCFHDFDKAEKEHLLEENRKRKRQREAPQNSAVIE